MPWAIREATIASAVGVLSIGVPCLGLRTICRSDRKGRAWRRWGFTSPWRGRSARVSGPGGGDSVSAYTAAQSSPAPPPPHPGSPPAIRPPPFTGGGQRNHAAEDRDECKVFPL